MSEPTQIDWAKRVQSLSGKAAGRRARVEGLDAERMRMLAVEGDELDPGPDLRQARLARWSSIVPARFFDAALDDYSPDVRERVDPWVARPRGSVLALAGGVGTGKTHLAIAAARALYDTGRHVSFWPTAWLWHKLRPPGDDELLEACCEVDLLVLDDLGAEKHSEWTREQLWIVVDQRWAQERPTIITTNLAWLDLKEAIGARVYDRLVNAETVRVVLSGESRRR